VICHHFFQTLSHIFWCLNCRRDPWKIWFWLRKAVVFKSKAAALSKFLSELSFLNVEGRSPDQGVTGIATWMNYCFLAGKEFHYDLCPKKLSVVISFTDEKSFLILVETHLNCIDPHFSQKAGWMQMYRALPRSQN